MYTLSVWSIAQLFQLCDLTHCTHQAPLSMGFSRQECWSGEPCPPPGDLPDPGIKPVPPASPALAGGLSITVPIGKPFVPFKLAKYCISITYTSIKLENNLKVNQKKTGQQGWRGSRILTHCWRECKQVQLL